MFQWLIAKEGLIQLLNFENKRPRCGTRRIEEELFIHKIGCKESITGSVSIMHDCVKSMQNVCIEMSEHVKRITREGVEL